MELILILSFIILLLLLVLKRMWSQLKEERSRKQEIATRHGQIYEEFFPFLREYPYNVKNFRFIGTPIDGVQFEGNEIVFIEFKSASSQLSDKQKVIRKIVDEGRVRFEEYRIG